MTQREGTHITQCKRVSRGWSTGTESDKLNESSHLQQDKQVNRRIKEHYDQNSMVKACQATATSFPLLGIDVIDIIDDPELTYLVHKHRFLDARKKVIG